METIVLYILIFIVVMTIILSPMRLEKIKAIGAFFSIVLPRIPLVGIVKAYWEQKRKSKN